MVRDDGCALINFNELHSQYTLLFLCNLYRQTLATNNNNLHIIIRSLLLFLCTFSQFVRFYFTFSFFFLYFCTIFTNIHIVCVLCVIRFVDAVFLHTRLTHKLSQFSHIFYFYVGITFITDSIHVYKNTGNL